MKSIANRRAPATAAAIAWIVLLTVAFPSATHGEEPTKPQAHSPSAGAATQDGTGAFRATSHKRFDDVEHWSRIFDDPERDAWQRPDQVVEELGIDAGDVVADIGAGTGYLAERLSRAVGPAGRVLAVEIEPNLAAHLRARAEEAGLENLTPILASHDDPRLPHGFVDVVVLLDTYHHIDHRDAYLQRLRRCLAPSGRIAVIDWLAKPLAIGPPPDHKIARERVIAEMQANGLRLAGESEMLEYQYFLIFEPA